ncbi:hypothetical protein N9F56_03055, partial [Akkermansiaceae bacterium]|nr:hypothetical protein [Akkermansiaceae bacterium]
MNIKQLREWLFLNSLENNWWINVDGKSLEKSENLDILERILWKNPNSKVLVLHVSQSQLPSPPWIEVAHG